MTEWVAEEREIPAELEDGYDHETYPPAATKWLTISEQLAAADPETWKRLAGYASVGEPTP